MTIDEERPKDINVAWREHCRSAVKKFVMNAVVIDNQPEIEKTTPDHNTFKRAIRLDGGMGEEGGAISLDENVQTAETLDHPLVDSHNLYIRDVSDAFAQEGIACAFVLPKDGDPDADAIFKRIIAASLHADIIVIDWYLRDGDPVLTRKVLREIATKDSQENGRMRLICIYTGQPLEGVLNDAKTVLEEGGLSFEEADEENEITFGPHHCLIVINKQKVQSEELPEKLLNAMTDLADGLLPAFSLAAVSAVRRNMHHIISRFPASLDPSFVANRLITDPPEDVTELIRELFVSECDTALGLEKVADDFLCSDRVRLWLTKTGQPKFEATIKGGQKVTLEVLETLLTDGLSAKKTLVLDNGQEIKLGADKAKSISHALHGGNDKAIAGESDFARFIVLKREKFGDTKFESGGRWVPSLTLGTILREKTKDDYEYYYCLTPACDTVRINGEERSFVMLLLEKASDNPGLVIYSEGGVILRLGINYKTSSVRTFTLKGDVNNSRIFANHVKIDNGDKYLFVSQGRDGNGLELEWLGEVRRNRANRDMAELNRTWLRLGIKDSEYLRLSSEGAKDYWL